MSERLIKLAESVEPDDLPFTMGERKANRLKERIAATTDFNSQSGVRFAYASELMNAGQTEKALSELNSLEKDIMATMPGLWPNVRYRVRMLQAIGYLRRGEEQNCCAKNTPDSCLLPVKGAGVHSFREGSTRAMALFEEVLTDHPDDLQAKWLLNIAAMTLGTYPARVPIKWRISPEVFKSEAPLKPFKNISSAVGLNLLGLSGGVIVEDFDGDGLLDIMISSIGFHEHLRLFHNNGNGTFTDISKAAGIEGEFGGLNLIQADYDNDGRPDVLILRGGWMGKAGIFPFSLLHNNRDGTFTDVTVEAGLLHFGPTQTAVWFDYDNDGKLDLFVGYESGTGGINPCALFHNDGGGKFTEVSAKAGLAHVGMVKAAISADYDHDGFPDLLLTQGPLPGGGCALYHNNGDGTFKDVTAQSGILRPFYGFSCFWFDYDNDGWPDLYVNGYKVANVGEIAADYLKMPTQGERSRLYHNNRNGTFTDVSHEMRLDRVTLGMGINFGDLDNDGWQDFYVGTGNPFLEMIVPNRMFRNADGKRFDEVTTAGNFGHLQKGHAIAFADINNDGTQDIFEEMGGANQADVAYSALYKNPGFGNHWVSIKLTGVNSNRSAIGARVCVTVQTSNGQRSIYRTVGSGGSFGANPMRLEIGLGQAKSIVKVDVIWPATRQPEVFSGIGMDGFYEAIEGTGKAVPLKLRRFSWPVDISSNR